MALREFADHLAFAFQVLDDIDDFEPDGVPVSAHDAVGGWPWIEWITATAPSQRIPTYLVRDEHMHGTRLADALARSRDVVACAVDSASRALNRVTAGPGRTILHGALARVVR